MPLKIAGSEISTIDALIVASSMPSVVLDSAIHLYGIPCLSKIVEAGKALSQC